MKALLLACAVILALLAVFPAHAAGLDELAPTTVCHVGAPRQMLCQHNYIRGHNGLQPLYGDPTLYAWAKAKLDRIIQCHEFSHTPCGDPFTCPPGYFTCSENIAYGYFTVRSTMAAWLLSPPHRATILSGEYRHYGAAFSQAGGNYCYYCWATEFAS